MVKPFLQLTALGVAGFALWKLASLWLLPFFMLALKVAVVVALVMLAIWYFKKNDKSEDDAAAG
jgi:membrane protein implicated in regulation of membrane protease activity